MAIEQTEEEAEEALPGWLQRVVDEVTPLLVDVADLTVEAAQAEFRATVLRATVTFLSAIGSAPDLDEAEP